MTKGRILIRLSSLNARGCYILAIFLIGFGLLQITGINFLQDSHVPGIIESAACFVLLNLGYAVSSFYINKKPGLLSKLLTRGYPFRNCASGLFPGPGSLLRYTSRYLPLYFISPDTVPASRTIIQFLAQEGYTLALAYSPCL